MDGFALHSASTSHATPGTPVRLRIAGSIEAGSAWSAPLGVDDVLRISTGAAVPVDCDAIVPIEDIHERAGFIEIHAPIAPGRHIRPAGEDLRRGAVAIRGGIVIRPQEIGLLAALGIESIPAAPAPVVSIMSTGPELMARAAPVPVNDANGPMLAALAESAGADIGEIVQATGELDQIHTLIAELAQSSDLILTSGGISNSQADTLAGMIDSIAGGELWELRLRPGKHFGIASFGASTLIALPGNPVAAFVGFELLGRLAIGRLGHRPPESAATAILTESVRGGLGRVDAIRGRARIGDGGQVLVAPAGKGGSGMVASLTETNCLILLPEEAGGASAGDTVRIRWVGYQ